MAQFEAQDLARAVVERMADCSDPRFKEVMSSLVRHAHAFVQDVQLTPREWMAAIEFLTATGKMCDEKRQEFILLSDTLGISMLVVAIEQAKAAAAMNTRPGGAGGPTEATVLGPFYREGAPELELGADIGQGHSGEPAYYHGRVIDNAGRPIAGCMLDVWSSDADGTYDVQRGEGAGMALRARFRTDANGNYSFWSIKPAHYPIPVDGPVGSMLGRMGRHPYRPAHIHTMLDAPGYERLITHLFVADSPYLDSDAVFGVRDSLIVEFKAHPPGVAPDGRIIERPFHSAYYEFRLVPTVSPGKPEIPRSDVER